MGRILAIDYGRKRIGIAVSDPLKIIANGLTTVSPLEIFPFLTAYFQKEQVDVVLVGWPMNLNNKPAEAMKYVEPFVRGFRRKFEQIPLELVDERYTSVLAQRTMIEGGLKKKARQNKALVDEISATIILQSYMESMRNVSGNDISNLIL